MANFDQSAGLHFVKHFEKKRDKMIMRKNAIKPTIKTPLKREAFLFQIIILKSTANDNYRVSEESALER